MPRFTLLQMFVAITLFAAGVTGLALIRSWDQQRNPSDFTLPILFASWLMIGIAVLVPFVRPRMAVLVGVMLGLLLGGTVFAADMFGACGILIEFRPCH